MKAPSELVEFTQATRAAIREIPKAWHELSRQYIETITRKDIFLLNVLAVGVGLVSGYAAIAFRYLVNGFSNLFLGTELDAVEAAASEHQIGLWIFLVLPLGLFIAQFIARKLAPEAQGHGVPEVMEAVLYRQGRIRKRVVAVKSIASALTIGSGGSVGREGPIIQIGAAAGSAIGQLVGLSPRLLKTLLGCGAAGAMAAAFNTPIAGVIFAIEVIILELKTKSFVPLVISSVIATIVARLQIGNEPLFSLPHFEFRDPRELIFYMALAFLSGIAGIAMIRTHALAERLVRNSGLPVASQPIIAGLAVAAISLWYPEILGVGYETIGRVLKQESTFALMAALVFLKPLATSLTLAGGGSGGVFLPSLFLGAMLGGAFGAGVQEFFPELAAGYGAYALVGMAAVFSSTARATFTAIVISVELTANYSIILPVMLVCVIADQTAWAMSRDSIYSEKLRAKGLAFSNEIGVNLMAITQVREIMTTILDTLKESATLQEAHDLATASGHSIYPIVDDHGRLMGVIRSHQIASAINQKGASATVGEFKTPALAVVSPTDNVLSAIRKIQKTRDPRILVVEQDTHRLCGIVSPIDLVRLSTREANAEES